MGRYEYYRDNVNQWRWRYIASNGKTIAVSSESYVNEQDCLTSIGLVKKSSNDPVKKV